MTSSTTTDNADFTAADVAWDLEPLVDGRGVEGVDALLDAADAIATKIETRRGHVAELDAAGLADVMHESGNLAELIGRAGSYAGLRFAVDTSDPELGALMQRVEERSTAINTRVLFFELEWAALPDAQVEELLADDRLEFVRHYLRSARRYRPHLLSEPEEKILAEKDVTGSSAWSRLFDELTSMVTVELDDGTVGLEQGLSLLASPDRSVRQQAAAAVTDGLAPGLRTRAFVFNTLLADKATDDRLRSFPSWVASRNLANEASDESVQALV
ncbi:MAG: M3 family oligoendopeptidase, partial [Acidimicrobiia bacterium]